MKLTGFFGFNESISLKAECLNRKIAIKIGSFKGRLLTPCLPKDFSIRSAGDEKFLKQPKTRILFNENLKWGKIFSWPSGESVIYNFILEIDVEENKFDENEKELLLNSTEAWIKRLRDNLFAYDYFLEHKSIKVLTSSSLGFELYDTKNPKEPKQILTNRENSIELTFDNTSLDFKTLKKVLNSTSENKTLCEEYKLIKNSKIAFDNKEYRQSVFESASALELCFTNLLKKKLKVNNDKLKLHILSMNNSIAKKVKLLKAIDLELPSNKYESDVSNIRNRAIHAGITVSEEKAENAYIIVKSTLDVLIKNRFV